MAHKTFFGNDGGIQKTLVSDNSSPEELVVVSKQDLDATFKSIARRREEKISDDFKPVAEIPGVIVEQMMRDGSWNDPAAIKRWLNDPANKCFRIWEGKV